MSAEDGKNIRLDMSLRQRPERDVKPVFEMSGVKYFDQLPLAPEHLPIPQVVLPMSLVGEDVNKMIEAYNANEPDPKKRKKLGFDVDKERGKWEKAGFGAFVWAAVLSVNPQGDVTGYNYDIVMFKDGPIDQRTGLATPSHVLAPVEVVGQEFYVRAYWEYRPVIWPDGLVVPEDITSAEMEKYIAVNSGKWVLSVPGGYAKFVGQHANVVAENEAMEEAGLKLDAPIYRARTFNRSNTQTMTNIGFSLFEYTGQRSPGRDERIAGDLGVNIKVFDSDDQLVQAAVDFAVRKLGLIHTPYEFPVERMHALSEAAAVLK